MYLLKHCCEYNTEIIDRGCSRVVDKVEGVAECLIGL